MGGLTSIRASGRPRRPEIRDQLLRAMGQLVARGATGSLISVERLSLAAGISRANFYLYYESKADLLVDWLDQTREEFADAGEAWLRLGPTSSQEAVTAAVLDVVDTYERHALLLAAFLDEASQNGELRALWQVTRLEARTSLASFLTRGVQQGWLDAELLPSETAAWLVWLLERGLTQLVGPGSKAGEGERQRLASDLADMLWHVLFADAPRLAPRGR